MHMHQGQLARNFNEQVIKCFSLSSCFISFVGFITFIPKQRQKLNVRLLNFHKQVLMRFP